MNKNDVKKMEVDQYEDTGSRTASSVDINSMVYIDSATPATFTIPPQTDVTVKKGQAYIVFAEDAPVTITEGSGVTFTNPELAVVSKNKTAVIFNRDGGDTWTILNSPLPKLATPVLTVGTETSTAIPLSVVNITNNSGYRWNLYSDAGYTTLVDTEDTAADDNDYTFTGLTPETNYYPEVIALGDNITYGNSNYDRNVAETTAAATKELLSFTLVNITNSSNVYTGISGGYTDCYGLATKKLAAGQNGWISQKYTATDAINNILAFNEQQVNQPYNPGGDSTVYEYAFWFTNTGAIFRIDKDNGGILSTGVNAILANWYRLIATGREDIGTTVFKIQTSADENFASGVTDVYTYTRKITGDVFVNICLNGTAGKMYLPHGFNLTTI